MPSTTQRNQSNAIPIRTKIGSSAPSKPLGRHVQSAVKPPSTTISVSVHPDLADAITQGTYNLRIAYIEDEDDVPPLGKLDPIETDPDDPHNLVQPQVVHDEDRKVNTTWRTLRASFTPILKAADQYWITHSLPTQIQQNGFVHDADSEHGDNDENDLRTMPTRQIRFGEIYMVNEDGKGSIVKRNDVPDYEKDVLALIDQLGDRDLIIWNKTMIQPILYTSNLAEAGKPDTTTSLGEFTSWLPGDGTITIPHPESGSRSLVAWFESIVAADKTKKRFATVDRSTHQTFEVSAEGEAPRLWYGREGYWQQSVDDDADEIVLKKSENE